MSVYQSTCERFICSPLASGLTAILSAVYFITYPSISSFILTTIVVKGVDMLQKALVKYDIERFKSFPRPVVEEDEQPGAEEQVEEQAEVEETQEQAEVEETQEQAEVEETQEQVEEQYHANDEREEDEEYIPSHKPVLQRRTYNLRNRMD